MVEVVQDVYHVAQGWRYPSYGLSELPTPHRASRKESPENNRVVSRKIDTSVRRATDVLTTGHRLGETPCSNRPLPQRQGAYCDPAFELAMNS